MVSLKKLRSTIHVSGAAIILLNRALGPSFTLSLIAAVSILYLVSEALRARGRGLPLFFEVTMLAATKEEKMAPALKPLYYALGIAFSILIFPRAIEDLAIIMLTVGDGLAGAFGRLFGRIPIPYNKRKTVEGSLLGFSFAFLSAAFLAPVEAALVGAVAGALTESLGKLEDNLLVPLSSGAVAWLFTLLIR